MESDWPPKTPDPSRYTTASSGDCTHVPPTRACLGLVRRRLRRCPGPDACNAPRRHVQHPLRQPRRRAERLDGPPRGDGQVPQGNQGRLDRPAGGAAQPARLPGGRAGRLCPAQRRPRRRRERGSDPDPLSQGPLRAGGQGLVLALRHARASPAARAGTRPCRGSPVGSSCKTVGPRNCCSL